MRESIVTDILLIHNLLNIKLFCCVNSFDLRQMWPLSKGLVLVEVARHKPVFQVKGICHRVESCHSEPDLLGHKRQPDFRKQRVISHMYWESNAVRSRVAISLLEISRTTREQTLSKTPKETTLGIKPAGCGWVPGESVVWGQDQA